MWIIDEKKTESQRCELILLDPTDGDRSLDSNPDLSHSKIHTSSILPNQVGSFLQKKLGILIRYAGLIVYSCWIERTTEAKWPGLTWQPLKADLRFDFHSAKCESKLSHHLSEQNIAKLMMIRMKVSQFDPFSKVFTSHWVCSVTNVCECIAYL